MTAREAAATQLARLPDAEMELVAGFLAWRDYLADIDEWGDLNTLLERASAEAMRDLDEREREEFGETLWEQWQRLAREGEIELPEPQPVPNPSMREAAERARERAEGLVDYLPEADMPLVLAFLAWRERSADLRREGADARMAAEGAEEMRLIDVQERRLFGEAWEQGAGERPRPRNPWTDPDPQPGDFDAELAAMGPEDVEFHEGNPEAKVRVISDEEAARLRRERSEEVLTEQPRLTIVYESDPDSDWIVVSVPEVPGALSQGKTLAEARKMILDALAGILELHASERQPQGEVIARESLRLVVEEGGEAKS